MNGLNTYWMVVIRLKTKCQDSLSFFHQPEIRTHFHDWTQKFERTLVSDRKQVYTTLGRQISTTITIYLTFVHRNLETLHSSNQWMGAQFSLQAEEHIYILTSVELWSFIERLFHRFEIVGQTNQWLKVELDHFQLHAFLHFSRNLVLFWWRETDVEQTSNKNLEIGEGFRIEEEWGLKRRTEGEEGETDRIRRQTIISRVLERKIERKSFKSVTAELQRMWILSEAIIDIKWMTQTTWYCFGRAMSPISASKVPNCILMSLKNQG